MVVIFFSYINLEGEYNERSYRGRAIESCFDGLNHLIKAGWHITSASLSNAPGPGQLELPVAAFTGELMRLPLQLLQRTWEYLLADQTIMLKQDATRTIDQATSTLNLVREKREHTKKRIADMLEKWDRVLARIQQTKAKWGVE